MVSHQSIDRGLPTALFSTVYKPSFASGGQAESTTEADLERKNK